MGAKYNIKRRRVFRLADGRNIFVDLVVSNTEIYWRILRTGDLGMETGIYAFGETLREAFSYLRLEVAKVNSPKFAEVHKRMSEKPEAKYQLRGFVR